MAGKWKHWCPSGKCGKSVVYVGIEVNGNKRRGIYKCHVCGMIIKGKEGLICN